MPLKIEFGGLYTVIGPGPDHLHITPQKTSVFWHGDEAGKAVVVSPTGATAEFSLETKGTNASYGVSVSVAPLEVGEPTTLVEWPIRLLRT